MMHQSLVHHLGTRAFAQLPELGGCTSALKQKCTFPDRSWRTPAVWRWETSLWEAAGISPHVHHHASLKFSPPGQPTKENQEYKGVLAKGKEIIANLRVICSCCHWGAPTLPPGSERLGYQWWTGGGLCFSLSAFLKKKKIKRMKPPHTTATLSC